jgi:hypothetical protein
MTRKEPQSVSWMPALRPVLDLAIGVNALMAVASIVAIITVTSPGDRFLDAVSPVPFVLALIFGAALVAGGFVVRATLRKDPRQGHRLATAYAGVLFVLGIALVVIWSVLRLGSIAPLALLLAFAFPAALAAILWGTPAVREYYGTLPEGDRFGRYSFAGIPRTAQERRESAEEPRQGEAAVDRAETDRATPVIGLDFLRSELATGAPTDAAPAATADQSGDESGYATGATAVLPDLTERLASPERPAKGRAASADPTSLDAIRAEAANRRTSAVRLREIASTVPEARAAVASNPKAYPDLLTWLGNLGDPEVDEALQRRQR